MRILIKVAPRSSKTSVERLPSAEVSDAAPAAYKVRVTAPAAEGKANRAVADALSEFFGVRKGAVRILRGRKSREKLVDIDL